MVGKYINRHLVYEEPCVAIEICLNSDGDKTDTKRFTEFLKKDVVTNEGNQDQRPKTDEKESVFANKFGFFFFKVTGKDELMDAYELQKVMQMSFKRDFNDNTKFSLETCRCLIATIDHGYQGSLAYEQFKQLWFTVMKWKHLFEVCDANKDRKIDKSELTVALQKLGFELESKTVDVVMNRYMNRIGTLNLDDFCGICSKLVALKVSYDRLKDAKQLTYENYFMESLYS